MNKILFFCNTYMQLLTAINMKVSMYAEKSADLLISDHSINAQTIKSNLERVNLFSNVLFVETKRFLSQSKISDLEDVIELTFCNSNKYENLFPKDIAYSEIFYYNYDPILVAMYDRCNRNGAVPKCIRYEEGILSYVHIENYSIIPRMKLARALRKMTHKDTVIDETKDVFCYYPELLHFDDAKIHSIPLLRRENKDLLNIYNTIFDYDPNMEDFRQKYIFFTTIFASERENDLEAKIVMDVADLVGKDNLLVKLHPRDARHCYEDCGIKVSRNSSVPWELIQLNHDFSNHVFLTVSSGSVINASAMLGDQIPTGFLFPLLPADVSSNKPFYNGITKLIASLKKIGALEKTDIIDTLEAVKVL